MVKKVKNNIAPKKKMINLKSISELEKDLSESNSDAKIDNISLKQNVISSDKPEIKMENLPIDLKKIIENKTESRLEVEVESSQGFSQSSSKSFVAPILKSDDVQELPPELTRELPPQNNVRDDYKPLQSENIRYSSLAQNFSSSGQSSNQRVRTSYDTPNTSPSAIDPSIKSSSFDSNPARRNMDFTSDELRSLRGEKEPERYKTIEFKTDRAKNRLPWEI